MNGYFVYALKSSKDSRIYVGLSSNPEKRLLEHNRGETKSTKGYRPWVLIYKKFVGSRVDARKEEKRLKSGYAKELLKSNIPSAGTFSLIANYVQRCGTLIRHRRILRSPVAQR